MAKKRTSIKDIAKALGISITTVSFILNGKAKEKRISEELTKKVIKYVKEVNYMPSHLAQSLRSGKSKVIVFMVEDISNQFFSSIARMIEEKAYKSGYKIIYCSTDNEPEKAKELIATFKSRNVDGFIITPTPGLKDTYQELLQDGFAVLLFDRWIPEINCNYVIIENEKSAGLATQHFIDSGFDKVAFVTVESEQLQMIGRLVGYEKKMISNRLEPIVFRLPYFNNSLGEASEKIKTFLQSRPEINGVFFSTNYLAFEGLKAINSLNLRVPGDLSVVSFDDHYFFKLFQPNISAIEQPLELIAEKLMEGILLQLTDDQQREGNTEFKVVLPTKFHPRASTLTRNYKLSQD